MAEPPAEIMIDPEILAVRAAQAKRAVVDITKVPIGVGRRFINDSARLLNDGAPAVRSVRTFTIAGPGGPLRMRLYGHGQPAAGVLLYAHGGGWFACDIDTHDRMLRELAVAAGLPLLAMDYRLAPEHPYPAALDDVRAAWHWLRGNIGAIDLLRSDRIVVAGDSAGANLVLAAMVAERDAGGAMPAGAALFYGCYAPASDTGSHRRYGAGGFGLTTERMRWYWANYLGPHRPAPPFLATPLDADLRGLPPHFIGIAACDVLADENDLLAGRLRQSGVDVTVRVWARATHGFLQMTRDAAIARDAVADIAAAIIRQIGAA